jgi:hypothetical protein
VYGRSIVSYGSSHCKAIVIFNFPVNVPSSIYPPLDRIYPTRPQQPHVAPSPIVKGPSDPTLSLQFASHTRIVDVSQRTTMLLPNSLLPGGRSVETRASPSESVVTCLLLAVVPLLQRYNSTVSLCLNFRDARSAERKRNWFPCNSNSRWGRLLTVPIPPSSIVARLEYSGTPNTNTEFCFGRTRNRISSRTKEAGKWNHPTPQLVFFCNHPERVFRLVNHNSRQSHQARVLALAD